MLNQPIKNLHRNCLFVLILLHLFCKPNIAETLTLKNEDLFGETWGPEGMSLGYYLEFKKNQEYVKQFAGPGSWMCTGKFEIRENLVLLGRAEFDDETPRENMDCDPKECTYTNDNKSLYRNRVLNCKPGKDQYWRKSATVKPGIESVVQGYSIVTMGVKVGRLKSSMKVRAKPNIESKAYYFQAITAPENRDSLPAQHEVTVLARTKEKTLVGKSTNYWYLVDLGLHDEYWTAPFEENIGVDTGWVFSEWVEIK